ncbi:hypothetical protein [Halorubrum pallidum]|uniref:Uncharacterized protein n=1 Tax=Halorubrum pallidum TaxID=1526114 RepID=A0ABD5T2S5_9EURY
MTERIAVRPRSRRRWPVSIDRIANPAAGGPSRATEGRTDG